MSKAYSAEDLSDQLDRDMTWRLKEFSDLKTAVRRADAASRPVLLRALVALSYAHWEGHVRFCAQKYFQHIVLRRISYLQLDQQFYINNFLVRIDSLFRSKETLEAKCALVEDIIISAGKRFAYLNTDLIDTKSNLNSDVIIDICRICGISSILFQKEAHFIDRVLLKQRNEIAHGEEVYLPESEMDDLVEKIVEMMRAFRNLLENRVYSKDYLRAT